MIKFKLLNERAIMPQRGTTGAAGFDLFCTERVDLAPKQRMLIPTGVACALPAGYVGQIWPRSGLAVRHGLDTLAGVIDEDYRGEIHISMINHGDTAVEIKQGEKIAQMLVVPYVGIAAQVDDLDSTERGSGGFGSTGRTAVENRECQAVRGVPERKAIAKTQTDVQYSWAERSGQDANTTSN